MGRKGPRPGLDERIVMRAAAELVDAEGMDALTLARLAEALNVKPPSLYNHISGLEGVRQGLAVMGARELANRLSRAAVGRSGADALFAIADAYRAFAKAHPGLYAASLHSPDPTETELAQADAETLAVTRAALAPFELDAEAEVHAMRAFRSLAHGFVSLELAGGFGMPIDVDRSYHALFQMLVDGLAEWNQHSGEAVSQEAGSAG